ncbi:DUF1826 domain-containing protein [Candidatus Marimicrobium litorale]|uniref:DUF1826 domain-containing protein n=1 Tax=Candidatus Marimicrobium litorale TaxID=2518991 RepID=A0ABT3T6C2_9GAMM|nr:DUF1826 domain-containing protein [Candidatus Marimicrobium litorale]MCX2977827.1 DUF1826 domain-containing protein [Candidatus Marimicrobium litorale]
MQQTASQQGLIDPPSCQQIGDDAGVLQKVTEPGTDLSLWRRPVEASIVQEIQNLSASDLQNIRQATSRFSFDTDVSGLLREQGLDPMAFQSLRADMLRLISIFSTVSEGRELQFRLLTTDSDDCRRFHLDRVYLRLLCTYQGPGTEWLTDAQVDREALVRCRPNSEVMRFGEASRFETFWVGILRGDPKNISSGQVHRSPPIADSGRIRVLFSIDC